MIDTNDILWKLRNTRWQGTEWSRLMFDAADEIERLRAALKALVGMFDDKGCYVFVEDIEQDEVIEARKILNEQLTMQGKI